MLGALFILTQALPLHWSLLIFISNLSISGGKDLPSNGTEWLHMFGKNRQIKFGEGTTHGKINRNQKSNNNRTFRWILSNLFDEAKENQNNELPTVVPPQILPQLLSLSPLLNFSIAPCSHIKLRRLTCLELFNQNNL